MLPENLPTRFWMIGTAREVLHSSLQFCSSLDSLATPGKQKWKD